MMPSTSHHRPPDLAAAPQHRGHVAAGAPEGVQTTQLDAGPRVRGSLMSPPPSGTEPCCFPSSYDADHHLSANAPSELGRQLQQHSAAQAWQGQLAFGGGDAASSDDSEYPYTAEGMATFAAPLNPCRVPTCLDIFRRRKKSTAGGSGGFFRRLVRTCKQGALVVSQLTFWTCILLGLKLVIAAFVRNSEPSAFELTDIWA
jgi:hypothetical protein